MTGIVLVSNLIGTGLPFLLNRLRLDPAVASSPLITSVADVAGLGIYFLIAAWILGLPS
jgi:magnesium transporter